MNPRPPHRLALATRTVQLLVVFIVFAGASLWSTSGFLRKNDQATILTGVIDWARGERQPWSHYYQFDKTYVLYAYTAAWLRINQVIRPEADPVRVANRAVAVTFWLALLLFLLRYRRHLDPLVLLLVLSAPALLLNTQYLNSTTLSSAWLLVSLAALPRRSWAALAFFLAVGARADVILLWPLYAWLTFIPLAARGQAMPQLRFPTIGKWREFFSNDWKTPLALLGAGGAALVLGRWWAGDSGTNLDWFFQPKMAAGYIAFGFGAAVLWWLGLTVRIGRTGPRWWGGLGALALLLPVLFFLPQLHAPRYFWRGAEALLMVAALAPAVGHISGRGLRRGLAVLAVLPLLIGLDWSNWTAPRLTVGQPTVFPSGDGHYPMGAYASFLGRFRTAETVPIDHNQRVWWAARSATFEPDQAGHVGVVMTPMHGYLMLAGSMEGQSVRVTPFDPETVTGQYLDSRTLMRHDVKFGGQELEALLAEPLASVSADYDGIRIVRVGEGDTRWGEQTRALNRWFAGDEYRIGPADTVVPVGRRAVWFAAEPFANAERDAATGWYLSSVPAHGSDLQVAYSALPTWMSVRTFR